MVLGPVETVYLLALVPAVLWGFTPVLDKRGMSLDGTAVQASLVVVLVDLLIYGVALLVLRGPTALAGIDAATAGVFLTLRSGPVRSADSVFTPPTPNLDFTPCGW